MARSRSRAKGLFKPPRWKYLAKTVTFENPSKARKAAKELVKEVKKSRRRDKALRVARALTYEGRGRGLGDLP